MHFSWRTVTLCLAGVITGIESKMWNNTGKGSIIFEECFSLPYPELDRTIAAPILGYTYTDLLNNLADIHCQRIAYMDEAGVDYMIMSLASPGIQGISDVATAERLATQANNDIADKIANNTMRFGAFAALSMHNATQAAQELRRCVKDLGFHGALLNDFQQAGADNNTLLYYNSPTYDVFWQTVVDLDVPVYLHPRAPTAMINKLDFAHAPWLLGAPHQFAVELSNHVAGLCTNGVFDRFPKLKIIVGHLGERLPSDFWRLDQMLARKKPAGMPMQRNFSSYWRTNIYETSTGNFWTELMNFHRNLLGDDRILYSVDYPFNLMGEGKAWLDTLPYSEESKLDFIRNNAIKMFKLDQ